MSRPKVWKTIPFLIFTYNSISLFVQYSILDELLPNIKVYIIILRQNAGFVHPDYEKMTTEFVAEGFSFQ